MSYAPTSYCTVALEKKKKKKTQKKTTGHLKALISGHFLLVPKLPCPHLGVPLYHYKLAKPMSVLDLRVVE